MLHAYTPNATCIYSGDHGQSVGRSQVLQHAYTPNRSTQRGGTQRYLLSGALDICVLLLPLSARALVSQLRSSAFRRRPAVDRRERLSTNAENVSLCWSAFLTARPRNFRLLGTAVLQRKAGLTGQRSLKKVKKGLAMAHFLMDSSTRTI